ncbi:unnamed protein product [Lasius platythorax]|uniref:Uncharacterized protein n=1 Tax=Lasius platythorax TaxID=488582 RepID=A0AAV2P7P7_9HYME
MRAIVYERVRDRGTDSQQHSTTITDPRILTEHGKATQVSPRTRPKPSLGESKDVVLREKGGGCVNLIRKRVAVSL